GWDVAQTNFNVQMDKAHAAFDALLIQLGTQLLPILTPIIGKLADMLTQLGPIGKFVLNSQQWKDFATNVGLASSQVGTFITNIKNAGDYTDQAGKKVNVFKDILSGAGLDVSIAAAGITAAFTFVNIIFDCLPVT